MKIYIFIVVFHIITGIGYFYYINTLKNCNCVNEEYIKDINIII